MTRTQANNSQSGDHVADNLSHAELTDQQLADLGNPDKQHQYREAYLQQLKRLHCPGCGDDVSLF